MTFGTALLHAEHVGVRELREHLSEHLKAQKPLIVTERGNPKSVVIAYQDMLELVEMMDELQDAETLALVQEGRRAYKQGAKLIPVANLIAKVRAQSK
ncbi:MAG: type II toxin-antitoxin system prevent-host-death family antitoxin [Candidatus Omnitrophica bacterium]|nr:type II toxin-antitoxin system prevent-host-death family antitoxin [Candidatus Omnitrophota bacterium]